MPEIFIDGKVKSTEIEVLLMMHGLKKIYGKYLRDMIDTFGVKNMKEFMYNHDKFKELREFYMESRNGHYRSKMEYINESARRI